MSFALVVTSRLDLESFAGAGQIHPDLVLRLVRLGLLEPERDAAGHLVFSVDQLAALARIERLRAGACLNYAAIGLVVDLLDRIAMLEADLARVPLPPRPMGDRPWIRTD